MQSLNNARLLARTASGSFRTHWRQHSSDGAIEPPGITPGLPVTRPQSPMFEE